VQKYFSVTIHSCSPPPLENQIFIMQKSVKFLEACISHPHTLYPLRHEEKIRRIQKRILCSGKCQKKIIALKSSYVDIKCWKQHSFHLEIFLKISFDVLVQYFGLGQFVDAFLLNKFDISPSTIKSLPLH
jgi:hypothetical protein